MKYLIVLKQETGTGRFIIKTSEGAYVSTQKDFVEVSNKEGHIELLIPVISVLFIEAIDSEKEEDCEEEKAKPDVEDEDGDLATEGEERKELTFKEKETKLRATIDAFKREQAIDKALKKFFNL